MKTAVQEIDRIAEVDRFRFQAILVVLACVGELVLSGPQIHADEEASAEAILNQTLSERERLVTGEFDIKGTRDFSDVDEETNEPSTDSAPFHGYWAFDWAREFFRFENTEKRRVNVVVGPQRSFEDAIANAKPRIVEDRLRYVRNAAYSARWHADTVAPEPIITLFPPSRIPVGGEQEFHHKFDVRSCGLGDYQEFAETIPPGELVSRLLALPMTVGRRDGDLVVLTGANAEKNCEVHIDVAQGHTPTYYRMAHVSGQKVEVVTVKWDRRQDVWVPTEVTIRREYPKIHDVRSFEFHLEWKSVNRPIPDMVFDYRSLNDIPTDGGVEVVDARNPQGMVPLGRHGPGGKLLPLESPENDAAAVPRAEKKTRFWLIVGANALIGAIGVWLIRRRVVPTQSSK